MTKAVERVLVEFKERFGKYPKTAQFDDGKEFYNVGVKTLLKDHDVHYFSTLSTKKAAIVERFNRTLKTRMWKYFTENKTTVCVDILPDLVKSYNHSTHRTIGMKPADVNEENKDEVWTRIYGYPLSHFPKPKFRIGDHVRTAIEHKTFEKGYTPNFIDDAYVVTEVYRGDPNMYGLRDPEDGEDILGRFYEQELSLDRNMEMNDFDQHDDYDWDDYDETNVDDDLYETGLEDLDKQDDELWLRDFRNENSDDRFKGRKRETNYLYTTGSSVDLKAEYMKKLFANDYRLNPNDGLNSRNLFSRLDVSGYWLTFDDVKVAFIDKNGEYYLSKNTSIAQSQKEFRIAFEKATEEHRKNIVSIVEEEAGGGDDASSEMIDAISDDVRDEIHHENIDDDVEFKDRVLDLHNKGKLTEQEARELVGITVTKGTPSEKIKYLKIERERLKKELETETDPERREILRDGLEIIQQNIDDANLEMRLRPESEEGKHRVQEKVRDDVRTKFEKF
ncbi:uncharacterized transposon-derived [Paramuricea clavata]|uniref:Uncharacterized transposon-derived n=1 Tax=Paramuricea clavata TaxID=317549 RepID=A0A7D9IGY4_PARCT|nr:uncharacterized transposon-derived [Paramuricea clavata]